MVAWRSNISSSTRIARRSRYVTTFTFQRTSRSLCVRGVVVMLVTAVLVVAGAVTAFFFATVASARDSVYCPCSVVSFLRLRCLVLVRNVVLSNELGACWLGPSNEARETVGGEDRRRCGLTPILCVLGVRLMGAGCQSVVLGGAVGLPNVFQKGVSTSVEAAYGVSIAAGMQLPIYVVGTGSSVR